MRFFERFNYTLVQTSVMAILLRQQWQSKREETNNNNSKRTATE